MRIAVLTPGYAPDPGGVESVVTALAEGMAGHGVDVEVWSHTPAGSPRPAQEQRAGVRVHRFATTPSHRFAVSPALWNHARRHGREVDVVHAHSYHSTAALGTLLVDRSRPVVFTPHFHGGGHTRAAELLHAPYRALGRRIVRRSAAVVAVSLDQRRLLSERFPNAEARLHVVHNAVDVTGIHAATPFTDEPPTALVLGRIEAYKRVDTVLAAFATSTAAAQLVIVGDGPDRPRIEDLVARHPRRQAIRVLGRLPRDQVDRWLRTAACVVSMSEHEAFGMVGLEGVAGGATALLSDLPAHREVVELAGVDRAAIVDPSALPLALDAALGSGPGEPRTVRNWTTVVEEYLAIYEDVLRHHQRR